MKYRLLASDIDGTLINSAQKVPQPVLESIEKLKSRGGIFTLATGRPIQGISQITHLISPGAPVITDNGAVIIRADNSEVIYQKNIDPESSLEILHRGTEADILVCIWSDNRLYVNKVDDSAMAYHRLTGEELNLIKNPEQLAENGISKCVWRGSAEQIAILQTDLEKYPITGSSHCTSTPQLLEFMHKDVSKGEGLKKLCEYCQIDISEAIAAGDEQNDISMLKAAGLGVAMGNSSDIVKAAADYIAPTNEENGLCDVIEKFML